MADIHETHYFSIDIPPNSKIGKELQKFYANFKQCHYCGKAIIRGFELTTTLHMNTFPMKIVGMVACPDCSEKMDSGIK